MKQSILNRARLDKFSLTMSLPPIMLGQYDKVLGGVNSADYIQYTVYGTPTPDINVPPVVVNYGGQHLKVSSGARETYPPLTLKFLVDSGYKNYWLLWKWLNYFNDAEQGTSSVGVPITDEMDKDIRFTQDFSKFISNFNLFALDEYDNKIVSFVYRDVFITGLSKIDFNVQSPEEISCTATFAYNQFYPELLNNIDNISG